MPAAGNPEKTRQLSHRNSQACAGLEAHKDAVADQLHERTQSQQPCEQAKSGDGEGAEACDLRIPLSVAISHSSHSSSNHK